MHEWHRRMESIHPVCSCRISRTTATVRKLSPKLAFSSLSKGIPTPTRAGAPRSIVVTRWLIFTALIVFRPLALK